MVLKVHTEEKTGSDLTGSSGATNRVLSLAESNVESDGIDLIVQGRRLMRTTEYTFDSSNNEITFLVGINDSDDIEVSYFTDVAASSGTLASNTDITRKLKTLGSDWSTSDIDKELEEAKRKRIGLVDEQYTQRYLYDVHDEEENKRVFSFHFLPLISFDKVFHNREEVDSSNYTIDLSAGTISFTSSWQSDNLDVGDEITFVYTPEIYKDIEVWIAMTNILKLTMIQTGSDVDNTRMENSKEHFIELAHEVNSRNVIPEGGLSDHAVRRI